jgi:hypothetical protein
MTVKLDHILLGAPDLDTASAQFETLTGVAPATGGTHPGHGTRNRLVSLGSDAFFEVIAPDPAQQAAAGSRAEMIARLPHPAIITFAIQTTDIDGLSAKAAAAGLAVAPRMPMNRTRPDGVRLDWTIIRLSHPVYGQAIPFAIDWQGSPHPSTTSPGGCRLSRLTVLHPEAAGLEKIYRDIGLDVSVRRSLRPGFIAELETPKGETCFLGM